MKFYKSQTVELKSEGMPGIISKVLPELRDDNHQYAKEAYEVHWVDGTKNIHMGEELSPIYGLTTC